MSTVAAADSASSDPLKPIRIVVGFTPGGGPDITARYVAQKFTEVWKQQVIVDNRPGAGSTLGANLIANANPDGYRLLSVSSAHAVAAAIYAGLPYDTKKDLAGITQMASSKYLLLAAPALGVSSLQRDALMPGMPTITEAGVAGYQLQLWFGLLTSAQAPKASVARLNGEVRRILTDADVKQRWLPIGLEPRPTTPAEFDKLVASDIDAFSKIACAANIRAE